MRNIRKLFENNNQDPHFNQISRAYVVYKKYFENLMLVGVWGLIHGFVENWSKNDFLA